MLSASLREAGREWLGTPYRWGGSSRRGIDCSAFVQQFVRSNLDIELPRTTASQRYEGIHVDKADLLPGDLVFFSRRGVRHVGVYLGNGEFIHASSSNGVVVSNLTEGYYNRQYWMARRIIEAPTSDRRPTPRAEARALGASRG
jgi:cell wall-associated NlpC family hydrolase